MKKTYEYSFLKGLVIAFSFLVIGFTLNYFVLASEWTGPTEEPPGANVRPPINTGSILQTRQGPLIVATHSGLTGSDSFVVAHGNVKAPNNVWDDCSEAGAWTCNPNQSCPDGKFVTEIRRNVQDESFNTLDPECGAGINRYYHMQIVCCGI